MLVWDGVMHGVPPQFSTRQFRRTLAGALIAAGVAFATVLAQEPDTNAVVLPEPTLPDAPATNSPPAVATAPAADTNAPLAPRELWFPVGERLVYRVYWGLIPVGEAQVWTEWVTREGRTLLAIHHRTRSNSVIAKIYPVNDRLETLVDPVTFLPVRFEKDMNEGRHRYHEITTFNYETLTAEWRSLVKNKTKTFPIEPDTRDLATFMYYLRAKPFEEGHKSHHRVMADEKIYDLYMNVTRVEKVDLDDFGKIACYRVEPDAKFEGLFVRKGKMTVWVSRDDRFLCTQIKASVPVADIRVVLAEVHGPGDDQWVKRSPKK